MKTCHARMLNSYSGNDCRSILYRGETFKGKNIVDFTKKLTYAQPNLTNLI